MKSKGIFIVNEGCLTAHDTRAKLIVSNLDQGSKVLVHVHKARWPDHHRLAWAVLSKIGDAIGSPAEVILLWLKHETGRVDIVQLPDGFKVGSPQSINFESMSQDDFQKFWQDALVVIQEKILGKLPPEVYDELRRMIAGEVD